MGAALNTAQAMRAYTISDRGTWLSFGNKGDLTVLVEGDPRLLNRYDVILLNPEKHPVPNRPWPSASRSGYCRPRDRRQSADMR
jgi:tungstate transport system substrate-binding protein